MQSFRSRHYPARKNRFTVTQENAMPYYGMFLLFVMAAVVLRMNDGKPVLVFGVAGAFLSILLGNLFAGVRMRRKIAEIFFSGENFSLISINDIVNHQPAASFPLRFANPTRTENEIQVHYLDQVMTLKREDWGQEFDLIWNWFIANEARNLV